MADPRIINLPDNPAGPDSSGVGGMLFERMQSQFKDAESAKQLDITEGIRAKYKAQAEEQANKYNQGMEKLRSALTQQRTDALFQQNELLKQKEAAGLEQMVGQAAGAGVSLPGMVQPPGETMGTATIPGAVNKINPDAITEARTQFAGGINNYFKGLEEKQKLSHEVERTQLNQAMDLTTDSDERQGDLIAGQFEVAGDTQMAAVVKGLSRAGQGSKSTFQKFLQTGVEKLIIAQNANEMKLQITREISQRNIELQKMKNQAKALLSTQKVDNTTYKNMDLLHKTMAAHLGRRDAIQTMMGNQLMTEMPGSPRALKLQADMAENQTAIRDADTEMMALRVKMAEFQNKTASGQVVPVPKLPGPKSSSNDPMGIRGSR